jgi:SAM-dependent methyltransferase
MADLISWEDAVRWYREQPGNEQAARDNYFDLPVLPAARRFAESEEFLEMLRLLGKGAGRRILDLGAGHGITSYAFAKHGWRVLALEPDPSREVGYGAIEEWRAETGLSVEILTDATLPFPISTGSVSAVFARQVLHHVPELVTCMKEVARILEPGGVVLTTRDHVVDDHEQLETFLGNHPLQHLYGGENAHPLEVYLQAFVDAGLEILEVWGPVESILNFFPGTEAARRKLLADYARAITPGPAWKKNLATLPFFRCQIARHATWLDRTPGRIYSIFARKPSEGDLRKTESSLARWLPPRRQTS